MFALLVEILPDEHHRHRVQLAAAEEHLAKRLGGFKLNWFPILLEKFDFVIEIGIVMFSQSDEVDGLAVHNFVAGVDLLVPGLRRVVVEDRHPVTGDPILSGSFSQTPITRAAKSATRCSRSIGCADAFICDL